MRYLFGDSSPFPPQYNFLEALEAFVPNAIRAVQLDAEVHVLQENASTADDERKQELETFGAFHASSMRTLSESVSPDAPQPTVDYVRRMNETARTIAAEILVLSEQQSHQQFLSLQSEVSRRRLEIGSALSAILTVLRLPTQSFRFSWRLQEAHNDLHVELTSLGRIVTTFKLATRDLPAWHSPRKVSDFIRGVGLPVGLKRGWFSKGVQHEVAILDEYLIGRLDLSDNEAEIHLRRKVAEKDGVVCKMRRLDGVLSAEVLYPGDAEADALPTPLDAEALAHVERLWQALRNGIDEILWHREQLTSIEMGDTDVVKGDLATAMIESIIAELAGTVADVARRSSNIRELCLKSESEKGRREELYIGKAQLLAHFESLGPREHAIFEPLQVAIQKRPAARPSDPPPSS